MEDAYKHLLDWSKVRQMQCLLICNKYPSLGFRGFDVFEILNFIQRVGPFFESNVNRIM